jgi:hypothetical protein
MKRSTFSEEQIVYAIGAGHGCLSHVVA